MVASILPPSIPNPFAGLNWKDLSWRWWRMNILLPIIQQANVAKTPCDQYTPKPADNWAQNKYTGTWIWYSESAKVCPKGPGYGGGHWYWHWWFSA
jgi:hypothetical protein